MSDASYKALLNEYRYLAGRYDDHWAGYTEATVGQTVAQLPVLKDQRILDVGCGTGSLLITLQGLAPALQLTGIDPSSEMLDIAERKLCGQALLQHGYAEKLPFADASFDTLLSTNVFHFVHSPVTALAEFHRVLRPGGNLIITDWCNDYLVSRLRGRFSRFFRSNFHRIYGSRELSGLLSSTGFSALHVERYRFGVTWGLMTVSAACPAG